jgi:hypothetical protein
MKLHPRLTVEVLLEMAERRDSSLDNPGVCIKCGEEQEGCEPDARKYKCEHCGENTVYAPEELLMGII